MRTLLIIITVLAIVFVMGCAKKSPAPTSGDTPFPDRSLTISVTSPSPASSPTGEEPSPSSTAGKPTSALSPAATKAPPSTEPASTASPAKSTMKAIDFVLKDLKGNAVTLSSFKGKKTVMLVFFATWCPNCSEEIPELKKLQETFKGKDFEILAVDVSESEKVVSSFVEKKEIGYTVVLDTEGKVAKEYNVYGIPTNVIVDKEGGVSYYGNGLPDQAEAFIGKLL
jgi:peroxiredoxin